MEDAFGFGADGSTVRSIVAPCMADLAGGGGKIWKFYETKKAYNQLCWMITHKGLITTKQTKPRPLASAAPHLITPAYKIEKIYETTTKKGQKLWGLGVIIVLWRSAHLIYWSNFLRPAASHAAPTDQT